ncbi:PBSX family phage terminase large subunit [Clostridium merdae]|uniref:PBSX family phage terminase large subunit n=1 Tax=Clostridium merdae TaxID=1958780 RepID=UPI000A271D3A|nr:PBSX family phage terminase large subunit [Clostridium merdae]
MGFSAKQKEILRFPYAGKTALICDGAVRSGKTAVMSLSYLLWAMANYNGQNFGICGKTVISAERNVIKPLLAIKYLKEHFAIRFANHILTVSRGGKTNTFYVFGGKDESSYQLIQGITLAGVLLDEVALMPRSFVEQALARCSVEGAKFWFNCNPANPQHWFYEEWIKQLDSKDAMHLHFLMSDNPSLSKETLARYESMYTGVFYRRYVLGEWVQAEGLVYPMFDREKHIISEFLGTGRYFISIDYGILNPFSAGLWCVRDGVAIRVAEYYHDGRKTKQQRTDEEHYSEVEKLAGDLYIERVVVDPSASSFIETVYRHGRFPVDKAKNDVIPGIAAVSSLLQAGKIQICECCDDCIREFEAYSWDPDKPEDSVLKEFDHAMDDVRYFTSTILRNEFRWENWR